MRAWIALLVLLGAAPAFAASDPFDFDALAEQARALALRPYQPPPNRVPAWLTSLDYDHYRDIRFRPPLSWWNHDPYPFKLQFFQPGGIYNRTVQLYEIDDGMASPIAYSSRYFDFGRLNPVVGPLPANLGFAGFRIHYALNVPGDELGVFQGGSYFRFLCRGSTYGLSARGLAINSGGPGTEEFPDFEKFWIRRPSGPKAASLVVYALLDSPSVAGAYRFEIFPGDETVMHIRTRLYFRRNPAVPGIAPLTSMFWHGKTTEFATHDIRPEVHDSDGLMLHCGTGEWLWRPLTNYRHNRIMSFQDENPRGFGLMQRERRFSAYDDLEARYQDRPSAWVVPINRWGPGEVRLVVLDTADERMDNVVAFWKPASLPPPGIPVDVQYDLHWALDQIHPPIGYCVETRQGWGGNHEVGTENFVVDFDGPDLRKLGSGAPVVPVITVSDWAGLENSYAVKNPYTGAWRVGFTVRPDAARQPVELRCFLKDGPSVLTETWSYLWAP